MQIVYFLSQKELLVITTVACDLKTLAKLKQNSFDASNVLSYKPDGESTTEFILNSVYSSIVKFST